MISDHEWAAVVIEEVGVNVLVYHLLWSGRFWVKQTRWLGRIHTYGCNAGIGAVPHALWACPGGAQRRPMTTRVSMVQPAPFLTLHHTTHTYNYPMKQAEVQRTRQ